MARINLYHQGRHVVIVDGVPLTNFAEGDFVECKQDGNAASRTHAADGPQMNVGSPQGGQLTIGLNPTSPALAALYALREQQQANPRLFNISVVTGVEDVIFAKDCAFGDIPSWSTGGTTMQPRKFTFECLELEVV